MGVVGGTEGSSGPSMEPEEGARAPNEDLRILIWATGCVPTLERQSVPEVAPDWDSPSTAESPGSAQPSNAHNPSKVCSLMGVQVNTGEMMTGKPAPFLNEFRPQVGR